MVTTFFPPHNFGGDGIHVYRLSNELARRGHEVTVVYPRDAYRLFTRVEPDDVYPLEPGVTIVPVTSTAVTGANRMDSTVYPSTRSLRLAAARSGQAGQARDRQ